jgi:iron uptake system component EfeO
MTRLRTMRAVGAVIASVSATAMGTASCGSSGGTAAPKTDAQFEQSITQGMHDSLQTDLNALVQATTALQQAAPDHPWDDMDPAYAAMQTAWINARHAYEHIEGATAPVFPDIDLSIDGRVEDFGPQGSGALTATSDMFGDQGMTGLHAIERIMYKTTTPTAVVEYETGLGYVPQQSFPTTQQDADEFKNKLCVKAVTDATALLQGWTPSKIDIGSAFQGLVALMNEQKEKVTKAGLDQEESRYSQRTMDDLRQNLTGTTKIYALFQSWIQSKPGGPAVDTQVEVGLADLNTIYSSAAYTGNALPQPPTDWSDEDPSAADLQTPFGQLYSAVQGAVDPSTSGSVVFEMNTAASLCQLPQFDGG